MFCVFSPNFFFDICKCVWFSFFALVSPEGRGRWLSGRTDDYFHFIFSFLEEKMKQNTLYKPQPTKYSFFLFFFHPSRLQVFHLFSWVSYFFVLVAAFFSMIGLFFLKLIFFLFASWFITISFMLNHCVFVLVLLHL